MKPEVAADDPIYDRLIAAILDRRLAPGTKLVEDRLAELFGVSRTKVRPVLVRLASERVITLTPNRGATVTRPTEAEAREVFEVRRLIEPRLVERFVGLASDTDIERLREITRDEEAARLAGDMRRAVRLSGEFHLHIAQHAGHETLGRILRELVPRTSLVLMTYGITPGGERQTADSCRCQEHHALIDAMRLRDAREAMARMDRHLAQLADSLVFDTAAVADSGLEHLLAP